MGDYFSNLFSNIGSTGVDLDSISANFASMSPDQLNALDFSNVAPGSLGTSTGFEAFQEGTGNLFGALGQAGSNAFDALGNKSTTNLMNLGLGGLNLANQYQGQRQAGKLANRSMNLNEDAYNRNVEADERRKKLRF